jgi:predicted transposase YbfD/YdcC
MSQPGRPLIDVLAEIPDPRQARGKRYPLVAVLALACAAMLCGYRSYSAIAEWGRNYGAALLQALGFPRATAPCAATLSLLFRRLDCARLEAALGQWAEAALAAAPPAPDAGEGLSLDGKTLRGSRKQGAPGAHLLSALSQRLGLTLAQTAVDEKTNEISAVQTVLEHVLLAGRVVTLDALLTQRAVAQAIVDRGGDYVMVAKDNQPHLRQDIAGLLATPAHLAAPLRRTQTVDKGHGRIERRRLTARALLPGDCDWPGAQQVFRLERRVIRTKTGEIHTEALEGLTSRPAEAADPQQVLGFLRDYWHIENKSHWVRDVTFDEDRSQVRTGAIPQVMAALRNTTIGLLRCAGATNIAAACRYYAAQPWATLTLLGIEPRTEN